VFSWFLLDQLCTAIVDRQSDVHKRLLIQGSPAGSGLPLRIPALHLASPPAFLEGMAARQVFYKGKVQGVGFRYAVKRIAGGFEVVGWVKNLPDGRVELQAMSEDSEELEAFLEEIENSSLGGNIKNVETHDIPTMTGVRGFSIIH
jgi:acylphosphatase